MAGRHASGVRVFVLYGPLFGGCSLHYSIIMGPKTVFELFVSAPAEAVRGSYTDSLNSPSFIPVPRNPTPVLDGFESRPKILKVTKYRASTQGTCAEAIPCTLRLLDLAPAKSRLKNSLQQGNLSRGSDAGSGCLL